MSTMPIAISGAGVAGMSTALHLAKKGHEVHLFEAAAELSEVGAGLQLSANALRCLEPLGLLPALKAVATAPLSIEMANGRAGSKLTSIPLGTHAEEKYGLPYLVIHRADLQNVLKEAIWAEPNITLHLGCRIQNAVQHEDGVSLEGGLCGRQLETRYACLIAADGVWSKIRKNALNLPPAEFSGRVAYRTTVPIEGVPEHMRNTTGLWMGNKSHLVHYPVHNGSMLNIVAIRREDWHEEHWAYTASTLELRKAFEDWQDEPRQILELSENWTRWALCGLRPDGPWHKGQIALIGDAAHAMLPFMAQGAAMGIEDAYILSSAIEKLGTTSEAFAAYEKARKPRVARVVRQAINNERIYHLPMPGYFARDMVLKTSSPESLLAKFDWIYGWKPEDDALN
ncbi:FAD-dependent oxidoreductase [Pseudovibrio sp. SPO723]|uniref:FAD-dependent oxidoreductase n=1 Tax=Nesiotobacter zosterae TaxID=392721 RepID=UPI0029C19087|nr:FAD-dependent oxidoreductase [Pseudovibrio sp. SPO723]MDX5594626.1 FAD-dependent monooxygenase [Pseudovibrio sp. SPO723]